MVPGVDPEPDSPAAARALARRFPNGAKVRVHYNPRDPADSVLYPEPNLAVWIIALAALVFGYVASRTLQ